MVVLVTPVVVPALFPPPPPLLLPPQAVAAIASTAPPASSRIRVVRILPPSVADQPSRRNVISRTSGRHRVGPDRVRRVTCAASTARGHAVAARRPGPRWGPRASRRQAPRHKRQVGCCW